jgi:hypothetical protein
VEPVHARDLFARTFQDALFLWAIATFFQSTLAIGKRRSRASEFIP